MHVVHDLVNSNLHCNTRKKAGKQEQIFNYASAWEGETI